MPCLDDGDNSRRGLPSVLELRRVPLWSLGPLRSVRKVKVISFLLGLTLTFLIMASYILTWDKKGLMLTLSPFHLRTIVNPSSTLPHNLSSTKDYANIKLLVKCITSKLEFSPRKLPLLKDVVNTDSHLFSVIPRQFLPNIKSPCWYEELSGKTKVDPYSKNLYAVRSKSFRTVCDYLRKHFQEHLYHSDDNKQYRLRCLPYFYIIGQPKCGTTDLFHRLLLHPEVKFTTMKEPHWWTRKRFGIIHLKDGLLERFPVEDYLDLFELAAYHIQEGILGNTSVDHSQQHIITGEASASTMWDNQAWSYLYNYRADGEPPFLAQDFIHAVQPNAKIIVMLRDPVERLYSDYLYFNMANKSVEDFDLRVSESLQLFEACLAENSVRSCVYNTSLSNAMTVRLNLGLYSVFLLDWLTVFHRDQILVLQLEDYAANLRLTIRKVFDFLNGLYLSRRRQLSPRGPCPTHGEQQTGAWAPCCPAPGTSSGSSTSHSTTNWPQSWTTRSSTGQRHKEWLHLRWIQT
ncbi:carbohydrate sulfotransferase 15-like isoform X1 [Oncorhynchus nerka]|uniref:carbohydrate sulfotransferase 15-like isoform X1 n=1 Tax=Oncorhynchus nerka TaxID=8023 RepID=UPI0011329AD2|nr:carbohydrate sulfotransferase 15-like isoform X1 [Oncorhynchus nerka]XP_029525172.1 carbohydrate sulfotransferase 15-like isoform X1 [Oncorhynchus nerka]XP_029525173.1 carbohydrate sulfotransferase 15-like isoform X1 [Oncorhynchus nerka]XP_029525175.1 carbohydrate sulfotransferase 15-like isoform X1 [Oncorhynchus nerka]